MLRQRAHGLDRGGAAARQRYALIVLVQDQAAQLRYGEVPGDQADEGEHPVLGLTGAPRLLAPGAHAGLDQVAHVPAVGLAPLLLALNRAFCGLQCLPQQQPEQLGVLLVPVEELSDRFADGAGVESARVADLVDLGLDHRAEQLVLGAEVQVDRLLVGPSGGGDPVDPGSREPAGGELSARRGEDALAGALRVIGHDLN